MKDSMYDDDVVYVCISGCEINNIPTGKIGSIKYWRKLVLEHLEDDEEWYVKVKSYPNYELLDYVEDHFGIALALATEEDILKYIKANVYPEDKKDFLKIHEIYLGPVTSDGKFITIQDAIEYWDKYSREDGTLNGFDGKIEWITAQYKDDYVVNKNENDYKIIFKWLSK